MPDVKRSLRAAILTATLAILFLPFSSVRSWGASAPMKVTIHIPAKSLGVMAFYFGQDKGFFSQEGIESQLVAMSPPTAIAALMAGELDFSTTVGAATAATMRGSPLRRIFYIARAPDFALIVQPEVKTIRGLSGKIIGVNAPTDAMGMSAKMILKGNGLDPSQTTLLATQITENSYKSLITGRINAALLSTPFAEEAEAKGYRRLADAQDFAPISTTGLVASTEMLNKSSAKVQAILRALLKTMGYLQDPNNRDEMVRYISGFHKIDRSIAERAFASILATYSSDGTKPRSAVEKEIEIYRETLHVEKAFAPEDIEDLSLLKKIR